STPGKCTDFRQLGRLAGTGLPADDHNRVIPDTACQFLSPTAYRKRLGKMQLGPGPERIGLTAGPLNLPRR
ncbi:MAG: hypothetical protein EBV92_02055, partial [Betaproteobacteria bacterium]|nr:hypothetical protein [Betaproteobacteria bacterium]